MYRLLYSCSFYLAIPLVLLRLLYRSIKEPLYREAVTERFGCYRRKAKGTGNQQPQKVIWVHAVSAGETIAAVPLIKRLSAQGYVCLVTHMTPTGRQRVRVLLANEITQGSVEYSYAPYDLPGSLSRFLDSNQPRALMTIDTELWPNSIAACHARQIPTMLINGRLSARSALGYARFSGLITPMLKAISLFAVQTQQHRDRFVALGVAQDRIHVTGSIKFDGEFSAGHEARLHQLQALMGARRVLLGASTHEGEESALVRTYETLQSQSSDALLVLVPRHTHRTSRVVDICETAGLNVTLFSSIFSDQAASSLSELEQEKLGASVDVLVVDVMGELENIYPLAQLAFVGGSLIPVGGHNLLEAVRASVPLVMGPHLDNIEDIAAQFIEAGGMKVAEDIDDLERYVLQVFSSDELSKAQVLAATSVLEANRGSLDRVEEHIYPLIGTV